MFFISLCLSYSCMKRRLISLIIIFLVIILLYLSSYPFGCKEREEIIIIGIDGGSWDIIMSLMNEGKLPNLYKLATEGAYGTLKSDESVDTSQVWNYIATGKREAEFENESIWKIVSERGKLVGTSPIVVGL